MKQKFLVIPIVAALLSLFFTINLFYFSELFQNKSLPEPEVLLATTISINEIKLGESFDLTIQSQNMGDQADIQIVSVAFPNLHQFDENIKITTYDFTQSPHYVHTGDEIGAKYTGGENTVLAEYPSIEAYSRPVPTNSFYNLGLRITPTEIGSFLIYTKTVAIPHSSELSHFPRSGQLDHQDEFVKVDSVNVRP